MDFGLARDYQTESINFSSSAAIASSEVKPDIIAVLQSLHASLDPRTVFACYGKLLGDILPVIGVQLKLPRHHLIWGVGQGYGSKQHIQIGLQSTEIHYRFSDKLTSSQATLLQKIEELLVQPLDNAIRYSDMSKQAMFDSLTNLGNRRYFQQMLEANIARVKRGSDQLSLIVLDLDNFKQLNDKFGHQLGDTILTEFGQLLRNSIRNADQAFRVGGDEFAILVHGDEGSAKTLCQRVILQLPHNPLLSQFNVMTSIGIAEFTEDLNAKSIYELADKAMYSAKAQGESCFKVA
ncbi:deoxycytidylate deaminase [Shewanella sp. OPT22]|nr:deoxycytidylate deaminase [Shewanella sp. OPT22]